MAQVLAIITGKESASSLGLTHEFIKTHYDVAMALYLSNHYVIKTESGYIIKHHESMWTRRVR